MSDDQLPNRAEMASAYLDGQLDSDERATVEGDPDTHAMVDSFARIRAQLNTTEPVDDAARSAAVAAALAEFDLGNDAANVAAVAAATPAAAVVSPLQARQRRGYRVLTGVAAAAVIAIVAVAALNSSRGRDENNSTAAVLAPADTSEPPQLKIAAADTNSAAAAGTAAPAGTVAAGAESIESAVTSIPEINSKEELQQFAANFQGAPTAPSPAGTSAAAATPGVADSSSHPACVGPERTVLGQVLYQGTSALVVLDNSTGDVAAIDAVDCTVLETSP